MLSFSIGPGRIRSLDNPKAEIRNPQFVIRSW